MKATEKQAASASKVDETTLGEVFIRGYRCRCGHEWVNRGATERPRVCPKCKSANWDRPKKWERKS
jgi:predicted Zn-ribbon and HTH transcriptional regulator